MKNISDFDISDRYGKNRKSKKLRDIAVITPSVSTTSIGNVTASVCYDNDPTTPIKSTSARDNVSVYAKCDFGQKKQNKSEFDDDIYNFCSSEGCSTPESFAVNTDVKITEVKGNSRFTYEDVHNDGDLLDTKKSTGPILENPDAKEQQTSDFIQKKIESIVCPVNDNILDLCDSETSTSSNNRGVKLGIITEDGGDRSISRDKMSPTAGYPVYREKCLDMTISRTRKRQRDIRDYLVAERRTRMRQLDIRDFLDDEAECSDDTSIDPLRESESRSQSEFEYDHNCSRSYYNFFENKVLGKYHGDGLV